MRLYAVQVDGCNGGPETIAIATSPERAEELRKNAYGGNVYPPAWTHEFDSDKYCDDL